MIQDSFKRDIELTPQVDSDDEFDGLDSQKKKSPFSLAVLLLCLVAIGGAAFFAYSVFLAEPDMPLTPVAPIAPIAEVPESSAPVQLSSSDPAANPESPISGDGDNTEMTAEALAEPENLPPSENIGEISSIHDATANEMSSTDMASLEPASDPSASDNAASVAEAVKTPSQVPSAPSPKLEAAEAGAPTTDTAAMPARLGPLPATPSANPTAIKTAQTIAAVNDILGEPAIVTPQAQKSLSKQVEVTSRASQLIIVKKTYNAQSPRAVNAAGERVLNAGQYNEAIEIYDQQLRNNSSDPLALGGKAVALQHAGRDKEAMETYRRLLDLNPRDVEALTNYLGLLQKQDPEQALSRLSALERQYPENAAISGQAAMVYAGMMDTPNALRSFQKASALDPTNPTYIFNIGVLYDRLGTADKAREAYRQALGLAQNYPDKARGLPIETIRNRMQSLSQ